MRLAFARKRRPVPIGSSYPTLMAMLCGTSNEDRAFSRPRLPPTAGVFCVVMLFDQV
jgi:hypothetical protein